MIVHPQFPDLIALNRYCFFFHDYSSNSRKADEQIFAGHRATWGAIYGDQSPLSVSSRSQMPTTC